MMAPRRARTIDRSGLRVPEQTSSTGPWRRRDQSGRTSIVSSPPGMSTVTGPWSQSPFFTAAHAAPQEEEPEASV
jgi:hypothetical protein